MASTTSPFLHNTAITTADTLAIIHISRDNLLPVTLRKFTGAIDGYAEGSVLNTRFGSFPHTTLVGIPWGSQVRASAVDTGSRGRKRKRREEVAEPDEEPAAPAASLAGVDVGVGAGVGVGDEPKEAHAHAGDANKTRDDASAKRGSSGNATGFVHVLRPSPELWTMSLPHRTQVVYTSDYSFILHRLRARPGTRLIEAGAGSGSFTHASARAVFDGTPTGLDDDRRGHVWSFEFNQDRFAKMAEEIRDHGLDKLVTLSHRNVYEGGFSVNGVSPKATAVFLDLPAPWEALRHLLRRKRDRDNHRDHHREATPEVWISPLDPEKSVHICTFSPCMEQVTRTISAMRDLGWVDIDMVEVSQKRYAVTRDRMGIYGPTEHGANLVPRDVAEALVRLKEVNMKTEKYHSSRPRKTTVVAADAAAATPAGGGSSGDVVDAETDANPENGENVEDADEGGKNVDDTTAEPQQPPWLAGRLQTRAEPELKTHTSYLVFAVLPREWSANEEERALAKWGVGTGAGEVGIAFGAGLDKMAKKKLKAETLKPKGKKKGKRNGNEGQGGQVRLQEDKMDQGW